MPLLPTGTNTRSAYAVSCRVPAGKPFFVIDSERLRKASAASDVELNTFLSAACSAAWAKLEFTAFATFGSALAASAAAFAAFSQSDNSFPSFAAKAAAASSSAPPGSIMPPMAAAMPKLSAAALPSAVEAELPSASLSGVIKPACPVSAKYELGSAVLAFWLPVKKLAALL